MINCRSLLYWGERISLVLPQTPPPLPSHHPPPEGLPFPELLWFLFYCKSLSLLLFTAKSLPHICSTANSLPPLSPVYLLRAVVFAVGGESAPANDDSPLAAPSVSYNQNFFFFIIIIISWSSYKGSQSGLVRSHHPRWWFFVFVLSPLAAHQRTLMTSLQTASEFTSVCFRLATNMSNMKYCTSWTHFLKKGIDCCLFMEPYFVVLFCFFSPL